MDDDNNYYDFYMPTFDSSSPSIKKTTVNQQKKHETVATLPSNNTKTIDNKHTKDNSVINIAYNLLSHFLHDKKGIINTNKIFQINGNSAQQIEKDSYKIIEPNFEGTITYVNLEGQPNRNEGPAVIHKNGKMEYYRDGLLHRNECEGPAVISSDGSNIYYYHGLKNRSQFDGPAETNILSDGSRVEKYYQEGVLHRIKEPAVIYSTGPFLYYENGKLHNEHGVASRTLVEGTTDQFKDEYFIHGKHLSTVQFNILKLRNKVFKNSISDMQFK